MYVCWYVENDHLLQVDDDAAVKAVVPTDMEIGKPKEDDKVKAEVPTDVNISKPKEGETVKEEEKVTEEGKVKEEDKVKEEGKLKEEDKAKEEDKVKVRLTTKYKHHHCTAQFVQYNSSTLVFSMKQSVLKYVESECKFPAANKPSYSPPVNVDPICPRTLY